MKKKNPYRYYMTVPALLLYTIFFIIPIILCFVTAFTDWNIRNLFHFSFNGIDNFINIFSDRFFLLAIKNTLLFAVITTVFKVLMGLFLAVVFTKPLKSRNLLRSFFYMPAILSTVVIGLIFTAFFEMDGMWDRILHFFGYNGNYIWLGDGRTALGCVIATEIWQWSGFTMMLFIAGMQGISRDYLDAAKIDGASGRQQFWKVMVPLLAPSFTVTIITNLIGGLKVFDKVYVLTNGGPGYATQVLGTYVYKAFSAGFLGKSSAMSLVLTIAVCMVTLLVNHQLLKREVEA